MVLKSNLPLALPMAMVVVTVVGLADLPQSHIWVGLPGEPKGSRRRPVSLHLVSPPVPLNRRRFLAGLAVQWTRALVLQAASEKVRGSWRQATLSSILSPQGLH